MPSIEIPDDIEAEIAELIEIAEEAYWRAVLEELAEEEELYPG